MAEGLAKSLLGTRVFLQSAGIHSEMDIDGFSIAVCAEIGIDISNHNSKSFDEIEESGEDIDSYDLIIALSPAAQLRALEYTRDFALEVEYWPTLDPTGLGETRERKLEAYRQCRDQLKARLIDRFGVHEG